MDIIDDFSFEAKSLLVNPRHAPSYTGVYVSPASAVGDDAARLVVVTAIDSREKSTASIVQTILDWWASHTASWQSERAGEALEKACRVFNEAAQSLTGKETSWLAKLHIVAAVYSSGMLHISQHGNTTAWLVRKGKIRNIAAAEKDTSVASSGIFSSLISGKVNPDDVVLLTTQSLFDFLSLEKINHALSNLDLSRGIELINNLYPSDTTTDALACVLMRLSRTKELHAQTGLDLPHKRTVITKSPHLATPSAATQASMSMLQSLERRTEELLDPTHWVDRKQVVNKLRHLFRLPPVASQPARVMSSERSSPWGLYVRQSAQALFVYPFMIFRRFFLFLATVFRHPDTLTTIPRKTTAQLKELPRRATGTGFNLWQRFSQLPLKQRALLSIIALVMLGFLASIAAVSQHTFVTKRRVNTEMLLGTIQGKIAAAEAALIYQDETKARLLVDEADTLLAQFPREKTTDQASYDSLFNSVTPLKEKVYHITNFPQPEVFLDFKLAAAQAAEPNPYYLATSGSSLYTIDLTTNRPLAISLSSASLNLTASTPSGVGRIRGIKVLDANRIIALQGTSYLTFSFPDIAWSSLAIPNASNHQTESLTAYAGRIYAVDTASRQIIRFTARGGQFQAGTPWLKNPLTSTAGAHIAVDGSLYLGYESGSVQKFSQGEELTDFSLDEVTPQLAVSDILTSADHASLFVLDRTNKRLVRFNKENGSLIRQYTSSWFDDLRGVAVTSDEKTAYLLNGSRIFKIPL